MRVKLLNDGGYGDMERVKFPVEVNGEFHPMSNDLVQILGIDLLRVGAGGRVVDDGWDPEYLYNFFVGSEVELVE